MKVIAKFSEVFSGIVLVSLFFLIINITTWINILALMYAHQPYEIALSVLLLVINFIIVLYPSITALTTISREWVINETFKVNPLSFFRVFLKNYKDSLIPGSILAVLFIIFTIDLLYFRRFHSFFGYFFMITLLLTVFLSFVSSIVLSHYEIKGLKAIAKAGQLLLYPPIMITLAGLTVVFGILFSFIGLSNTALLTSLYFYLLFSSFYKSHTVILKRTVKISGKECLYEKTSH